MRLGAQPCYLEPGTLAARCYGQEVVEERHRHRWEVNPAYLDVLREHGMVISGSSRRAVWPRSSSCRTTRSSSRASSTRSSGPGPRGPTRCSASSSAPPRPARRSGPGSAGSPSASGCAEPARSAPLFRGRWVRVDEEEWPGIGTVGGLQTRGRRGGPSAHPGRRRRPGPPVPRRRPADDRGDPRRPARRRGRGPGDLCRPRAVRGDRVPPVPRWSRSAPYHTSPGSSSELVHLFCRPGPVPNRSASRRRASRSSGGRSTAAVADARAGRIDDAKTALALLLADARMAAG